MTEIPLKGNIRDISLPKILSYLNRLRKTGTLIIKTPVFTKKVYLSKGDAIFASSTYEDDRLGEMLIKAGKLSLEQYEKSVELLKKTGKRQGAILVELGYITPKDLFWGVKYQVNEIIHSLFLLEDAEYEFIEEDIPANEVITLKMSMGNLIYEGVKRIDNWTRIKNEMPEMNIFLKLSNDPAALFQNIELSQQDRRMLSTVDGTTTIKGLIDNSWIGSFEALKILYVLWSIGVLEEKAAVTEKVPEEVAFYRELFPLDEILQTVPENEEDFIRKVDELYLNHHNLSSHELLELEEDADEDTITKHYYRLSRDFHPDRSYSTADPSLKDKLTAIFDAITNAYDELKGKLKEKQEVEEVEEVGEVKKLEEEQEVEEVLSVQNAEDNFKQGIDEFKKGNFQAAVDLLRSSTKLEPENAKYWSYLSLSLTKIPNSLKEAEEALWEAIKIEPNKSDHYVNLGTIYMKAGTKKRAYSQFEKALKIDPENSKAKKGLEMTG